MIYNHKKEYRSIHQMPFCCVPATLQWVLYRRNLDILNQEIIGLELGLRLPIKAKPFFVSQSIEYYPNDMKISWGTQILKHKYSINKFFNKYKIPLTISHKYTFNNSKELETFIINNFNNNNDIILRWHTKIFDNKKGYGHFSVISEYNSSTKVVTIGDPNPLHYKKLLLNQVLETISRNNDNKQRGLYIIC